MEVVLVIVGLAAAGVCMFVVATKLEERRPTVWDDRQPETPAEGEEEKRPPSLLERLRDSCDPDRILTVALLVACAILGVRDGDFTLPIIMGILLAPGLLLGF